MNIEDIRDAIYAARDEGHEPIAIEVGPDVGEQLARLAYGGPRRLGAGTPVLVVKELFGYPARLRRERGWNLVFPRRPARLSRPTT